MSPDPASSESHYDDENSTGKSSLAAAGDAPQTSPSAESVLKEPGFLHPSSVLFEVISHIRQYIVPAVLGLIGAAQGSFWWTGVAIVVFAVALAQTLIRYFTLRYGIQGDDFIVTEGLLFRRVRSVPLRRIQNMDLAQNVLHRMFGVLEVNIETASGSKPEATLRVLTSAQIDQLRQAIFGAEANQPNHLSTVASAAPTANAAAAGQQVNTTLGFPAPAASGTSGQAVYTIPVRDLVSAGLASNRGLILLGIAVGFFFQFDIEDRLNLDLISDRLRQQNDPWQIALVAVGGILILMLLLRILGIAWYILRFYDYRLTRLGEDLRISCGLLTKVSATIPRKRIQFISVHRPLLMRWLGLASIRVETAGGAGSEHENAAATVSRRWFLPVVAESETNRILAELRPDLVWESSSVTWHGVSPLAARRLTRVALVTGVILSLIGLAVTRPWGWIAGPAVLPVMLAMVIKKSRSRKYARTAWGVAFQSGIFNRKLSFSFYDRIQGIKWSQSPFDRRWKMATLSVDTAAAGPAEHSICISYLDHEFACQQFGELHQAAAEHRPTWA